MGSEAELRPTLAVGPVVDAIAQEAVPRAKAPASTMPTAIRLPDWRGLAPETSSGSEVVGAALAGGASSMLVARFRELNSERAAAAEDRASTLDLKAIDVVWRGAAWAGDRAHPVGRR